MISGGTQNGMRKLQAVALEDKGDTEKKILCSAQKLNVTNAKINGYVSIRFEAITLQGY